MFNELRNIAIVMAWLVLALVHRLAFPVSTASDVELPFSILHELMVLVERAHKDSVRVAHLVFLESDVKKESFI